VVTLRNVVVVVPSAFVTVRKTVYVAPCVAYVWLTVGKLPSLIPVSPNSQRHEMIAHDPVVGVDVLVKTTGLFLFCCVWVNAAKGGEQAGVGEGVGAGLGVGAGVGPGVGSGVGVGVGVGVAVAPAGAGTSITSAIAVETRVMSEPPVKADISGVNSWKCPVTVTVASVPYSFVQAPHESVTSPGATVTKLSRASLTAAQTTELVTGSQVPAT
jgi:hypothetical protein